MNSVPKNFFFWTRLNSKHLQTTKLNVAKILIFVSDRVENIVGKGENADYQHFLLFQQCFQRLLFQGR